MIKGDEVLNYWNVRSSEQRELTVGPSGFTEAQQLELVRERKEFFFWRVLTHLKTLDFGCGIGLYSDLFEHYTGIDCCENLLKIAQSRNPSKKFILSPAAVPPAHLIPKDTESIFTSTVLQHNDDNTVSGFFKTIRDRIKNQLCLQLYEHLDAHAGHVKGRSYLEYKTMVSMFFTILYSESHPHVSHGEKHCLSIFIVSQ